MIDIFYESIEQKGSETTEQHSNQSMKQILHSQLRLFATKQNEASWVGFTNSLPPSVMLERLSVK